VPQLIAVYAWTRMATSFLTLLSFWQMRRKFPNLHDSFRVRGGTFGILSVIVPPTLLFAWAMLSSDPVARPWGLLMLAAGPVAYFFIWLRRRTKVSA
jgi:hypothetical protein